MKRKYLAIVLSLSMVFSVTSPVMASSDGFQVVEESLEDTFADVESEVSVSLEEDTETVKQDTNEEQDNIEITQFSDAEDDFDDGSETTFAVGDNETTDDTWTPLENEASISFKYDESNKTLYFKCSGTAALPDNKTAGFSSQWALALGDKTKEIENVEIGEGITRIGAFNFNNKLGDYPNLKTVKLSSTVTTIGDSAFEKASNLKEINLNQVECVENKGLTETGIEQAIFEKAQVQIGENAFNNCTSLKNVEVKEVTNWGDASFAECTGLTSFQYEKTIEVLPRQTFMNCAMLSICSIKGAKEVGLHTFYIHSNISPDTEKKPDADHVLMQMDLAKVRQILISD